MVCLQGIRIFPYLDDLLSAESKLLQNQVATTLNTLKRMGFIINLKKLSLAPTQDLVFLGARIQTAQDAISLPHEKAKDIADMVLSFQLHRSYPAR